MLTKSFERCHRLIDRLGFFNSDFLPSSSWGKNLTQDEEGFFFSVTEEAIFCFTHEEETLLRKKKKPYSGELHSWNGGHQLCGTSPNEVRGFTKNLPLIILIKSCYDGEVVWGHGGHILQPLWPKCQLCAASLFEVEAEAKNVPHPTKMKSHFGGEAIRGCGGCWEH